MWFREALAVRRALVIYVITIAIVGASNAWGAGDSGGIMLSQALEVSCLAAIILGLVIGTNLGRELGALGRSALLRPISRGRYACTVFAVDLIALAFAYLAAGFLITGTYELAHGFAPMDVGGVTPLSAVFLPLAAIAAFYAVTVASGVATRGALATAVLLGPVCLGLWIGAAIYAWPAAPFFRILCFGNPAIYFASALNAIERAAHPAVTQATLHQDFYSRLSVGVDAALLLGIAIGGLFVTTLLWTRAEA